MCSLSYDELTVGQLQGEIEKNTENVTISIASEEQCQFNQHPPPGLQEVLEQFKEIQSNPQRLFEKLKEMEQLKNLEVGLCT